MNELNTKQFYLEKQGIKKILEVGMPIDCIKDNDDIMKDYTYIIYEIKDEYIILICNTVLRKLNPKNLAECFKINESVIFKNL